MSNRFSNIVLLTFLFSNLINAQSLSRHVIGTAGKLLASEQVSLSSTIGQAGLSGTLVQPDLILHIGFQQMEALLPLSIIEYDSSKILVYPNPFIGSFTIDIQAPISGSLSYHLVNTEGKIIGLPQEHRFESWGYKIFGSLQIPPGIYYMKLRLTSTNGKRSNYSIPLISLH